MQVGGEWEPAAVILQDPILSELLMARRNIVETVNTCESHINKYTTPFMKHWEMTLSVAVEPAQVMKPNPVCTAVGVFINQKGMV